MIDLSQPTLEQAAHKISGLIQELSARLFSGEDACSVDVRVRDGHVLLDIRGAMGSEIGYALSDVDMEDAQQNLDMSAYHQGAFPLDAVRKNTVIRLNSREEAIKLLHGLMGQMNLVSLSHLEPESAFNRPDPDPELVAYAADSMIREIRTRAEALGAGHQLRLLEKRAIRGPREV